MGPRRGCGKLEKRAGVRFYVFVLTFRPVKVALCPVSMGIQPPMRRCSGPDGDLRALPRFSGSHAWLFTSPPSHLSSSDVLCQTPSPWTRLRMSHLEFPQPRRSLEEGTTPSPRLLAHLPSPTESYPPPFSPPALISRFRVRLLSRRRGQGHISPRLGVAVVFDYPSLHSSRLGWTPTSSLTVKAHASWPQCASRPSLWRCAHRPTHPHWLSTAASST